MYRASERERGRDEISSVVALHVGKSERGKEADDIYIYKCVCVYIYIYIYIYEISSVVAPQVGKNKRGKEANVLALMAWYNAANKNVATLCNHQRKTPPSHSSAIAKMDAKIKLVRIYMLGGCVNPHKEQQTIPQGQTSSPPKSFFTPTAKACADQAALATSAEAREAASMKRE